MRRKDATVHAAQTNTNGVQPKEITVATGMERKIATTTMWIASS
jgi:hypothetical protein